MAREEKQANIYAIPKNSFDTGYVFGGQFKTRNFVEGVVSAHAMYDTDENRRTQDKAVSNGTFKVQSEFCPSIQEDSKKR